MPALRNHARWSEAAVLALVVMGWTALPAHAQTSGFLGPRKPSAPYSLSGSASSGAYYSHGGAYSTSAGAYLSTPATSGYYFGHSYVGPSANYANTRYPSGLRSPSSGLYMGSARGIAAPYTGRGAPVWSSGYGCW